jgi:hypothetical protein
VIHPDAPTPPPEPRYPTSPVHYGPAARKFRRFQLEYADEPLQEEPEPITAPASAAPPIGRVDPDPLDGDCRGAPSRPPYASRLGISVLAAALALGVLGDGLLRAGPPGLNVLLCAAGLGAAALGLARWQGIALLGDGRWLLAPALCFAAAFAWRDSPTLKVWNGLALTAALVLFAYRARSGSLRLAGLVEYLQAGLLAGTQAIGGPLVLVFRDVRWSELASGRWYGPWLAVGRGLLLAGPLLLVFGGLFMAADAVFEGLITTLFRWNLGKLLGHAFMIGFLAWLAAGLLRQTFLAPNPSVEEGWDRGGMSLGLVELGVALGLLNLLFLAFVAIQVPYFFGGAATVLDVRGPTFAEYARRGFFELVTVAALVLPLLLLAHWLLRQRPARQQRAFNLLAGLLVAQLFVIVASALLRMSLYREIYGETELRLYTTAFMLWLAVVFVWFLLTVLRGQRRRFAFGALLSGFAALAILNALNPDALIVRTNIGREFQVDAPTTARTRPQPLDESYLLTLSADAVPTLVELLPSLPPDKAASLAPKLAERWRAPAHQDWRAWNWGRYQAWSAVGSGAVALHR